MHECNVRYVTLQLLLPHHHLFLLFQLPILAVPATVRVHEGEWVVYYFL